jgi:hypothetical protein
MSKAWKEGLQMAALGVGVTVIGLVVGAFVMSPEVSREERITAVVALGGAAGLIGLLALVQRAVGTLFKRRHRRVALSGGRMGSHRPATAAPPTVVLRPRSARTPRTVQALAAEGAAPSEIARKTGLPFDAVAMLLELHGPPLVSR